MFQVNLRFRYFYNIKQFKHLKIIMVFFCELRELGLSEIEY